MDMNQFSIASVFDIKTLATL